MTLNGWQRLWIFVSVVYLAAVVAFSLSVAPSIERMPANAAVPFLSDESLVLLLPPPDKIQSGTADSPPHVVERAGLRIEVPAWATNKESEKYVANYLEAMRRALRQEQWQLVKDAALWWCIPVGTAFCFGIGIAWVRRGFRKPAP